MEPAPPGLSSAEAAVRLAQYGPNRVDTDLRTSFVRALFGRLRNPLVLVLIGAAAILAATGDAPSFIVISVILLLSILLDVVQEYRAGNAAEKLRAEVCLTSRVWRDGRAVDLATTELVPGDVVQVAAGDLVPADCKLLAARDLYVNEALLTGEAYPAEKHAGKPDQDMIRMGCSVVSGTATATVAATGRASQLGAIAGALRRPAPPTAFALGIRDFGRMIVQITIFLVLFTLFINLLLHRPPLESFLFAVALAVGLTPELLPMIVSVTLAEGALRLSRRGVIVKRLSAVHDLGSMDILCSDKTGTLTEARITLMREVDASGAAGGGALRLGRLNAAFETGLKSPLDDAILAAGKDDLAGWTKLDEVPFDFERRRVSVLAEGEGRRIIIVKGAPEDILPLASHSQREGGALQPLDAAAHDKANQVLASLGGEGLRVLAVAWREAAPDCQKACIADESDLVLAGFLAFLDPPKAGAAEALAGLAALGVTVKVLTGDNPDVTRHVGRAIGLDVATVLTGPQIALLDDAALESRLGATTLFCRVTPQQKSRILAAFRHQGHVVGYLGDGINDAPSLHAADVGFSVDTAVDVAKDAASMILLRKDLGVLADGVREGRRTFANIMKYVMMGTSSNFGNMFSMAGGALLLPFLPMLPIQILLNNLLYDLSEIAIPMDRVDPIMLARPRRWNLALVRKFMFVLGPISSLFDFVTFFVLLRLLGAGEALFHTGWFVESLATQVLVIFIIRTADPLHNPPHPALVVTSLAAVGLALLLPFTAAGAWLGFVPMPGKLMAALALVTLVYLGLVFVARRWFFARFELGQ